MGGFNIAILISLFYVLIGIRVVRDIWKHRATVFDDDLTPQDRYAISQAAFFVFIPLSVALHEFGHAVAIWSFGGKVIDFGFYFFAGFVSYAEPFTPLQVLVVAAAGTIVNILIFAVIFAVVLFKRPPLRPAYNELLITFAVLQAANALIFYPMLDFAFGMEGDWSQMYSSDAGNWRWVVLAIHASLLLGAFWFSRQRWFRLKLGALTGLPPGTERGLMGGAMDAISGSGRQAARTGAAPVPQAERKPLTLTEERMVEAANRVASGWAGSVQHQLRSTPSSSEVLMVWSDGVNGAVRAAALRALPDGSGELWGLLFADRSPGAQAERRPLKRWEAMPDANELTLAIRIGMEEIGRWKIPNATKPADV
jgi:hypothetical protein